MYSINCSFAYKFLCVCRCTYQSKIGIEDLDLEDIDPTSVSFPKDGNEIIFDLETTGLGN